MKLLLNVIPFTVRMRLNVALMIPFFTYCVWLYLILDSYSLRKPTVHSSKLSCEISAFIAGNCVLCCLNSEFKKKINKITNKTNQMTKIFAFLSVLYVILLIFFVNSLLKQESTELPAMKAVISHEKF
jgi:hypothetical protein